MRVCEVQGEQYIIWLPVSEAKQAHMCIYRCEHPTHVRSLTPFVSRASEHWCHQIQSSFALKWRREAGVGRQVTHVAVALWCSRCDAFVKYLKLEDLWKYLGAREVSISHENMPFKIGFAKSGKIMKFYFTVWSRNQRLYSIFKGSDETRLKTSLCRKSIRKHTVSDEHYRRIDPDNCEQMFAFLALFSLTPLVSLEVGVRRSNGDRRLVRNDECKSLSSFIIEWVHGNNEYVCLCDNNITYK